ncbi:MAG: phytanoyl-CoA dioxygenase family protein [Planctomycetota bacterium]
MTTVYFDSKLPEHERRARLFRGDVFVFSPRASSLALASFAHGMLQEAFATDAPECAQYTMPVERFVEAFAPVKPQFIHHPRTKDLVRAMAADFACDLNETYLDVPRLRGVTSDGYLTSGVGYAHHAHRDSWYAAPMAQLNWWIPLSSFDSASALAFLPRFTERPIANSSHEFNYYDWNTVGRQAAASQVKSDTRKQPKALEPLDLSDEVRVVCEPGGIILFSGSLLHVTVPNTTGRTRFSIDLRTVNGRDLAEGAGMPNVDSAPQGTSLRDFVRGADGAAMPEEWIQRYENVAPRADQVVVFKPDTAAPPPSDNQAA